MCAPVSLRPLVVQGRLAAQLIGPRGRRYGTRTQVVECSAAGRAPRRYEWRPVGGPGPENAVKMDAVTVERLVATAELLDGPAACRLLDCSPTTLRRLVAAGEIAGRVIGPQTHRHYRRSGIENYLAAIRATQPTLQPVATLA